MYIYQYLLITERYSFPKYTHQDPDVMFEKSMSKPLNYIIEIEDHRKTVTDICVTHVSGKHI